LHWRDCGAQGSARARKMLEPLRATSAAASAAPHSTPRRVVPKEVIASVRCASVAHSGPALPELSHPYAPSSSATATYHSLAAFRRLENKMQVFPPESPITSQSSDAHHRGVADRAHRGPPCNWMRSHGGARARSRYRHPHSRTPAKKSWTQMRRFGDRFDHNLHALRIVESFEHRYARSRIESDFRSPEGIVKHSRDFEKGENPALDEYLRDCGRRSKRS